MNDHAMPRRDFMKGAAIAGTLLGVESALAQDSGAPSPAIDAKVPRRKLGKTGIEIPILIMGCTATLDPQYDKRLHRVLSLGVDYFDTGQIYGGGQSQKSLATFVKQTGDRKKLLVSTKVKLYGDQATVDNFSKQVDACLTDLQMDYLDGFFVHQLSDPAQITPEIVALSGSLKKSNKTRFFGFSTHDGNIPALLNKAAEMPEVIDAVMFKYSFREFGDVELNKAMDACKKAGIGMIAMKTIASVPDDQEKVVQFKSQNFTLGQAKLKAVWADERIDGIASKMSNLEEALENVSAAVSQTKLAMEEYVQLNRLAAHTAPWHCRGCSHRCEACGTGELRIAEILRYLMYYECHGEREEARQLYQALRPEERCLAGTPLEEAMRACPQGIDLAARLAHAEHLLSA